MFMHAAPYFKQQRDEAGVSVSVKIAVYLSSIY